MKQVGFPTRSTKYFLSASVGMIVLLVAAKAEATSIVTDNLEQYDGVSCKGLMEIYKRAYISVGFKFSSTEMFAPDVVLMKFTFPNPTEPKKPSGGGSFMFNFPKEKELSCAVNTYELGVLGHWDEYSLEQHEAFEKMILSADEKAQALIKKRVGAPKTVRHANTG